MQLVQVRDVQGGAVRVGARRLQLLELSVELFCCCCQRSSCCGIVVAVGGGGGDGGGFAEPRCEQHVRVEPAQRLAQEVVEAVRAAERLDEAGESRVERVVAGLAAGAEGGGGGWVLFEVGGVGWGGGFEEAAEGFEEEVRRGGLCGLSSVFEGLDEVLGAGVADVRGLVQRGQGGPDGGPAAGEGLFDEGVEDGEFVEEEGFGGEEVLVDGVEFGVGGGGGVEGGGGGGAEAFD